MTAVEMQFAALKQTREFFSNFTTAYERGELSTNDISEAARRYRAATGLIINMLSTAEAFTWSPDCARAAKAASFSVPMDSTWSQTLLPSQVGWWWFNDKAIGETVALSYCIDHAGTLMLCAYGIDKEPEGHMPVVVATIRWRLGESLSSMMDRETHIRDITGVDEHGYVRASELTTVGVLFMARFFIAGCVWLRQRVLVHTVGHIERHRRKQLAREHHAPAPIDVKVIQLRRSEAHTHQKDDAQDVEWSCRWVVGGHFRNQPYKDRRETIYISPFVKGPSDKPLRIPSRTVYEVSR